ncbi:MAG: hypothetical protein C0485_01820 [Pirellula sp.]|nr:hypothetical protein [Pirellula sp.]
MIIKYRDDLVVDPDLAMGGEPGRNGVDGRDGVDSKDGRDGNDAEPPRGWTYVGDWSAYRSYSEGDVVTNDGSSYLCVRDNKDREPPGRQWAVVAAKGDTGRDGERGGAGPRGMPSPVPFGDTTAKATFDSAVVRGNVVRVSGTNHVDLALAHGSDAASLAVGLANGAYGPGQQGSYTTSGPFTCEAWNFAPGECLYLSPTVPGGVTNVFPNTIGDRVIILGMMLTPTTVNLKIHWALIIGS